MLLDNPVYIWLKNIYAINYVLYTVPCEEKLCNDKDKLSEIRHSITRNG